MDCKALVPHGSRLVKGDCGLLQVEESGTRSRRLDAMRGERIQDLAPTGCPQETSLAEPKGNCKDFLRKFGEDSQFGKSEISSPRHRDT